MTDAGVRRVDATFELSPAGGRQTANRAGWDAAVRELADRVAAILPPQKIHLTVNNLSSLGPDEPAAISEEMKAELTKRHFLLAGAEAPHADVVVTLSEGENGYVIVAQVKHQPEDKGQEVEQVAMVQVSKDAATNAERIGGVSLEAARIWEQAGAILDFALPPPVAREAPEMIVLERGRLVFYSRQQDQWQLGQAVIIPPARPWLRAERGHIDLSHGLAMGSAGIPGIECNGDFTNPQSIECGFVSQDAQPWLRGDRAIPTGLDIGGEATDVGLRCDERAVVLSTGKGDWTEPDLIQAFEMDAEGRVAARTAGSPAEFPGPVTSLSATASSGVARAVVHNLKTGNYEAYVVTASCSH